MVALMDENGCTGFLQARHHCLAMKGRYEELGWEFNDEDFWKWYDNSKYAAKVVCEKLRRSTVGKGVYGKI